jgi:hypothetical protein
MNRHDLLPFRVRRARARNVSKEGPSTDSRAATDVAVLMARYRRLKADQRYRLPGTARPVP